MRTSLTRALVLLAVAGCGDGSIAPPADAGADLAVADSGPPSCGGDGAAPGIVCAGRCVDPLNDPAHCGGCGRACMPGEACVGGTCQANCPMGTTFCSGACVDLRNDPANCG